MLFVILCQDVSIVMLAAVAWLSVEKIATAASISDAPLRSCCCCWMTCWHEDNAMCDAPLKRLPLLSHDVLPRSCQHICLFYSTTVGLSYSLPFSFCSTEHFLFHKVCPIIVEADPCQRYCMPSPLQHDHTTAMHNRLSLSSSLSFYNFILAFLISRR